MVVTYNEKKVPPYRRRLSQKKGWKKRRYEVKKLGKEIGTTDNEFIDCREKSQILPDTMNSEDSIPKTCLDTTMKGTYENVQNCEDDNTLVIDNAGLLDIDSIQEHEVQGCRIMDVSFFLKEMHRTFDNHARGIECQFKDWKLINSRRYGLLTQFFFKCQMCNYQTSIWSQPTDSKILDINTAVKAGTIAIGIGYAQLEEMYAAANMPCMSEKTYIKHRELVIDDFEKTAIENMKMAGEVEKQLALDRNEIINGIPYITVVADGSWMKRSYGTAYDSLSGVGAIIGNRTRKVLFVGIRNKFCTVCDIAERKGIEAKVHKCYKNFDRNARSTRMESDAIAEGFKSSIEMPGLIFRTVIADGDSSVYQSIIDNNPYREQMVTVRKIECTNHLLRNLCKKLKVVAETTQPKLHRKRCFVQYRQIVKNNILKIRKEILEAAVVRREEKQPPHCVATELRKDILNIPSHVFGEHRRCKERGRICEGNDDTNKKNYVPFLKLYGLYKKIQTAVIYLSAYSDSLLLNVTNNPAESFNSIICKEIGGKRINFGARGSYNARIAGAVVQYNTQQVLTELHKSVCESVPSVIENLEKRRQIKVARTRESREVDGRQKKFKREIGTDCHYGPQSQKPDLSLDILEQLKQNHFETLFENAKNWKQIECDTREQSGCELWQSLRKEMLTASNFGVVCRMRPITSCARTVKNILFPPFIDTAAMKYGRDMEEMAKQDVAVILKREIKSCGLFIDYDNPFLGASPDGLFDEDGLLEIKCPFSAENLTAEEAVKTLPQLKNIFDKKNANEINRNHRFFYQIQGQLNITQRDYCIFAVWTPKSIKTVRVNRDKNFWQNQMLPLLTRFYNECLLPEILDSRHNRNMPIRDPKYIIEEKEKSKTKVNRRHNKKQYIMTACINEKLLQENKQLKCNDISTETSAPVVTAALEQEDCVIISHVSNVNVTATDKARRKKVLDDTIIPLSFVKENVLPKDSKLNDESLDRFLRVVRETSCFETQSVQYIEYPDLITASHSSKSIQIIGGNCTDHWRCVFFDGLKLHVYDSIPGCTYDKLASKEKKYISTRFPQVVPTDISFEKVQMQPDGTCCEIYAAAFATDVVLGKNPSEEKYSNDVESMRRHFFTIVASNKLLPFPRQ